MKFFETKLERAERHANELEAQRDAYKRRCEELERRLGVGPQTPLSSTRNFSDFQLKVAKLNVQNGDIVTVVGVTPNDAQVIAHEVNEALTETGIRNAYILLLPKNVEITTFPSEHREVFEALMGTPKELRS